MSNKKVALITGINGQDGSYLAELLLEKGYEVWGTLKRNSVAETQTTRIEHIREQLKLEYADMTDISSLIRVIQMSKPNEIYNLAAQSHVRISFDQPIYTANVTALGTLNLLEAIRLTDTNIKMYQASSSEMFGNSIDPDGFQRETTPLNPVSPYGCSKVFSYNITRNYRNAYGIKVWNAIIFNHETISDIMPVIIKKNNKIDIKPISEVVENDLTSYKSFDKDLNKYQEVEPDQDVYVWDKNGWTKILYASGYPHLIEEDNKNPKIINSKNACYFGTGNHACIMEDGSEKKFEDIQIGDNVSLTKEFEYNHDDNSVLCEDEAEFLGFTIADGYYHKNSIQLTQKDASVLDYFENISIKLYNIPARKRLSTSGFTGLKNINQYNFNNKKFIEKYKIYNTYKEKVVPIQILNSPINIKKAFLKGYYKGDGLKSQDNTIYEYKSFKTNSSTLAMGLIYLFKEITNQKYNVNHFFKNNKIQYQVNLLSDTRFSLNESKNKYNLVKELLSKGFSQRKIQRDTKISRVFIRQVQNGYIPNGIHHYSVGNNTVKKINSWKDYNGWFFDLTTETETFHVGVGHGHVHNSPRRGTNFVTNKVVKEAVRIKLGLENVLKLGNLDATRDWSHAKDMVYAMFLIMQTDEPDDYVFATGVSHSVRELCDYTFTKLGLDYKDYVKQDEKFLRPEELTDLKGDSTKARTKLGWKPTYTFETMLDEMIQYWLDHYNNQSNPK